MRHRWLLWLLLLLSLGVNVGLLATRWASARSLGPAEPPRPASPRTAEARREPPAALLRLVREMGLEGQRREVFLALQQDFLVRFLTDKAEVETLQRRMRRELTAAEPDRAEIDRTVEQLARAYAELEGAFVDNFLASRELLDPRQKRLYVRFLQRVRQARIADIRRHLRGRQSPPWRPERPDS